MRENVHARRDGRERSLQRRARRDLEELVGVEREHEIGVLACERRPRELGHVARLEEFGFSGLHNTQGQTFALQLGENVARAVQ